MSLKSILKKTIGAERLSNMKGQVFHIACKAKLGNRVMEIDNRYLEEKWLIDFTGYHTFRGYYDLNYLSADKTKFLVHRLPVNANNNRDISCEIGYVDMTTGDFHKVAETHAWCWQQGSRLRWHPVEHNCIIFNDADQDGYCAKILDVDSGKCVQKIPSPLYDVTPDFSYGLTLNYSRLQRLRPGYGYNFFDDATKNESAPQNDGIWRVDLNNNSKKMLFSLGELAQKIDSPEKYIHYLNHISVSPDGKKFFFFHIYKEKDSKNWKTVLYLSDINGENLKALEGTDRVSHYCWCNNDEIMVTCRKENGEEYYCLFNLKSGVKTIIDNQDLSTDGHPNRIGQTAWYLTDTYPLKYSCQKIKMFRLGEEHAVTVASFYHDYRLRGEKRCDLHPSITHDGQLVSVDTTFQNGRRAIMLMSLKGEIIQ